MPCLLSKKDLIDLIYDEELFSAFTLTDQERNVLYLNLVGGLSFQVIGAMMNVTRQRAFNVYKKTLVKIKNQGFTILRQHARRKKSMRA